MADSPSGDKWIGGLRREGVSQLAEQARLLEGALSPKPELRREFQAEMLRLKWAERVDAWQQRAKALR